MKRGEGRREVARQHLGAEERSLEGGGAFKSAALCSGWLSMAGTNRSERLVTPSWQPPVHSKLLPAVIDIQEESRARSPRQSAAVCLAARVRNKNESCLFYNLCHRGDNGMAIGTKNCGFKAHSLSVH